MSYDLLLGRLVASGAKPRKTGCRANQVRAHRLACPICGGRDKQKLAIWEKVDGIPGAHCYACGGNAIAIFEAVGLSVDDLVSQRRPEPGLGAPGQGSKKPCDWLSLVTLCEKLHSEAIDAAITLCVHADAALLALELLATADAVIVAAREAMRSEAKGQATRGGFIK